MSKLTHLPAALFCLLLPLIHAPAAFAQDSKLPAPRHITLEEAVDLALKHNHVVRISQFQIEEKQHTKELARSAYFPTLRNDSNLAQLTDTQFIGIPEGSLGTLGGIPLPSRSVVHITTC